MSDLALRTERLKSAVAQARYKAIKSAIEAALDESAKEFRAGRSDDAFALRGWALSLDPQLQEAFEEWGDAIEAANRALDSADDKPPCGATEAA